MSDPLFSPQWIALTREAAIASQSLSAGLTGLRKANYAATGLYSHAFFSLSIGFERLLKLIFLLETAIQNAGAYPTAQELRNKFGHDIEKLFTFAWNVHLRLPDPHNRYAFKRGGLEDEIIKFMRSFAASSRYYNLDYLTSRARDRGADPIAEWYGTIGNEILQRHYSVRRQQKDLESATLIEQMLGPISLIRHTAEDGSPLTDIKTASLRTGENKIVQKYGTFYCAKIVRFLYMLLYYLNHEAHRVRMPIPYLYELFFPFMNEDDYLLSRKTFSPLGQ